MYKDMCALIVSYNPDSDLVNSCNALSDKVDKIIIVDNASNKETIEIVRNIEANVKNSEIIYNKENYGIAKALNIGFNKAIELGYRWVLTLDDDSIINDDMIPKMFEVYSRLDRDDIAVIAPKYLEKKYSQVSINEEDPEYEFVDFIITSGNIVNVEKYKAVNGYDDNLFIDYVDYDFCFKLINKGYKILKVNNANMLHSLGESRFVSIGKFHFAITNHNSFRRYYMTRNRMILWKRYKYDLKNWIRRDKLRFFNETVKIVLFEKDKSEKFKAIIRGIKDSNKYGL